MNIQINPQQQAMQTAKGLEKTLINILAQEMFKTVEMTDMGHEAKQFKDLWIEAIANQGDKGFGIAEKIIYPYLQRKLENNEAVEGMESPSNNSMVSFSTFNQLLKQQQVSA